ncbi:hypothetical protein MMC29_004462 [Sticta canariensis]|nr:hypothetical protein [Sticta canariensis]
MDTKCFRSSSRIEMLSVMELWIKTEDEKNQMKTPFMFVTSVKGWGSTGALTLRTTTRPSDSESLSLPSLHPTSEARPLPGSRQRAYTAEHLQRHPADVEIIPDAEGPLPTRSELSRTLFKESKFRDVMHAEKPSEVKLSLGWAGLRIYVNIDYSSSTRATDGGE